MMYNEEKNIQLVQLNQEKDEFLEIAAHDLRNPLSAIKGVVSLMEENKNRDVETMELTNLIKISKERMLNLINNFLDVTVKEQAASSLNINPVDPRNAIRQIIE
ncbi:MAG: histidine kinase dimerization/phospho-acceptor domain-containing protein [Balneolales bacterium]